MKYARWWILPVMVLAAGVVLSAQGLGDPLTNSAGMFQTIFLWALRAFGVVAVGVSGGKFWFGRGDPFDVAQALIGGALVFGARPMTNLFFPGMVI